jgi:hypothetical protein
MPGPHDAQQQMPDLRPAVPVDDTDPLIRLGPTEYNFGFKLLSEIPPMPRGANLVTWAPSPARYRCQAVLKW